MCKKKFDLLTFKRYIRQNISVYEGSTFEAIVKYIEAKFNQYLGINSEGICEEDVSRITGLSILEVRLIALLLNDIYLIDYGTSPRNCWLDDSVLKKQTKALQEMMDAGVKVKPQPYDSLDDEITEINWYSVAGGRLGETDAVEAWLEIKRNGK